MPLIKSVEVDIVVAGHPDCVIYPVAISNVKTKRYGYSIGSVATIVLLKMYQRSNKVIA